MPLFAKEFNSPWPLKDFDKNLTTEERELLLKCLNVKKPEIKDINIQEFIKKSNEFPITFPIDSCRVKSQPVERHFAIEQQIASAYPLMHEKVLYLIIEFLQHKIKYGSSIEKELYSQMSPIDFVQRLLDKRCVCFVGHHDSYILISGETGHGEQYLKIGTEQEKEPLILEKCLSYDEIKIAALLSVSSYSEFINDGKRHNSGKVEQDLKKIERQGVVVGVIGARFAQPEKMEYEDIVICKEQNITEKGYGGHELIETPSKISLIWQYLFSHKTKSVLLQKLQDYRRLWNKFYEEKDHLYTKVSRDDKRFGETFKREALFDNLVMKKRFAISLDLLLLEANARALKEGNLAYIHVVGIGMGVWLAAPQQERIFMQCLQERLKYLLPHLNNVDVVHLSWFKLSEWEDLKNEAVIESETHERGGIKILISKRNPNEKLLPPYDGMLSVVSFAWDGNALPGNEFWMGSLVSSNDPSAACSTLITELFNPHINTEYVNAHNLHLASPKYGLIHIKDYVENVLKENYEFSLRMMSIFGKEFDNNWPLQDHNRNLTTFGQELLQKCLNIEKPHKNQITIEQFIQKSNEFPVKFPIDSCRVKTQPVERRAEIQKQIESTYPLIHEKVLYLIIDFLEHKLKYGTTREKQLYTHMTPIDFVQRLLIKRCVSFVGFYDSYMLISGETGCGEKYLKVGTDEEVEPLTLDKVLSYDEIKISALLTVTTYSEFINDGRRNNCGKEEQNLNKIEKQGVVIGLVGARFTRPDRMECEDIKISKTQNTWENGYGQQATPSNSFLNYLNITKYFALPKTKSENLEKLQDYRRMWNLFYEESDHLYKNVSIDNKRFGKSLKCEAIFDNLMMKKRYAITFDTLLLEANARALEANKFAYIHVVGIGLGVWLGAEQQEKIFMECFQQRLKYSLAKLNNIGVVHLSWFHLKEWGDLKHESVLTTDSHPRGGIKVLISKRNPNEKLMPPYDNMLPVVSYAWDGNALPGNEFWKHCLASSNDPSTACSTLISELFNPHINTIYANGNNLHTASLNYGILHVKDYVERILKNQGVSREKYHIFPVTLTPKTHIPQIISTIRKKLYHSLLSKFTLTMSVFGKEFEQIWPPINYNRNLSPFGVKLLKKCLKVFDTNKNLEVDLEEFKEKSELFPLEFPLDSCRVKTQPVERYDAIKEQIQSAYPVIHEKVVYLIIDFLEYKLKYGTRRERKLYKNMSICDFIQRLLTKRCASFYGTDDDYLLLSAATGFGRHYLEVGCKDEWDPLTLKNVLSYDEIKISALLSVSSKSEFINDGDRYNKGIKEPDLNKIEREGIVVGVIGARFERREVMEFQDITITANQNTLAKGYGCPLEATNFKINFCDSLNPFRKIDHLEKLRKYRLLWNNFYEEPDHLFDQVQKDQLRFADSLNCYIVFDNLMMKKRYAISFDTLLLETNARAMAHNMAYLHVVGFGLGAWRAAAQQERIFMECFYERLNYLREALINIAVVHFSYFNLQECGKLKNGDVLEYKEHPRGGIKVLIGKRNPNEKLPEEYKNMVLVVSYAWDGNALPGNEFWMRNLTGSNDPSTACSTLISEIHNPHINSQYVCGENLHIATYKKGIIHIADYAKHILRNGNPKQ
ncbi:uncharacterized protein ACRADG_008877 [Cochliomyia hominivorax]